MAAAVWDRQVLYFDSSNVESIACLASHHFYTDQPEIALRFYRRLLQVRNFLSCFLISATKLSHNKANCL
jgi:hypothetical protein